MGGRHAGQDLVRADQVAPVLPSASGRSGARPAGGRPLRRSRFLNPDPARLKDDLVAEAGDEGFDICRITVPDAIPLAAERLATFLRDGHHGTMDWLADRSDWRASPDRLWPEARSVIMLGMNYGPSADPLAHPVEWIKDGSKDYIVAITNAGSDPDL